MRGAMLLSLHTTTCGIGITRYSALFVQLALSGVHSRIIFVVLQHCICARGRPSFRLVGSRPTTALVVAACTLDRVTAILILVAIAFIMLLLLVIMGTLTILLDVMALHIMLPMCILVLL